MGTTRDGGRGRPGQFICDGHLPTSRLMADTLWPLQMRSAPKFPHHHKEKTDQRANDRA